MKKTIVYIPKDIDWFNDQIEKLQLPCEITNDINVIKQAGSDTVKIAFDCTQSPRLGPSLRERDCNLLRYKNFDYVFYQNSETPHEFDQLVDYYNRSNVSFLTTGGLNYPDLKMRVSNYENFFIDLASLYRQQPSEYFDQIDYTTPKEKYFDALLGIDRPHRVIIYEHLKKYHHDKCILTMYGQSTKPLNELPEEEFLRPADADSTSVDPNAAIYAALIVDFNGTPINICYVLPREIYNRAAYSIVAETCTSNGFAFVTEKTAKPIFARRLFVAFAGQYHLRHLKNLGFKTFDSVIDESYDDEADFDTRMHMALAQVDRLCRMDQQQVLDEIQPVVEHNFRLITTTDWQAEYDSAMKQEFIRLMTV